MIRALHHVILVFTLERIASFYRVDVCWIMSIFFVQIVRYMISYYEKYRNYVFVYWKPLCIRMYKVCNALTTNYISNLQFICEI